MGTSSSDARSAKKVENLPECCLFRAESPPAPGCLPKAVDLARAQPVEGEPFYAEIVFRLTTKFSKPRMVDYTFFIPAFRYLETVNGGLEGVGPYIGEPPSNPNSFARHPPRTSMGLRAHPLGIKRAPPWHLACLSWGATVHLVGTKYICSLASNPSRGDVPFAKREVRWGGRVESERHGAESQWIVAARPLCHLQYPVAYLSRLQKILPAAR